MPSTGRVCSGLSGLSGLGGLGGLGGRGGQDIISIKYV